jgi:hypothetical protein
MIASLGDSKPRGQDPPKPGGAKLGVAMHALRRQKLATLLRLKFKDDRGAFLKASGLTKGRLSQLLDPKLPFGDIAARNLETRLQLDPGFFDSMDERTVQFALAFESLPDHQKERWEQLAAMLSAPPPG